MDILLGQARSRSSHRPHRRHAVLVGGLLLAGLTCTQAGVAPVAQTAVQAVWKQQEINFYFQSFTTFYSCRSLADKVGRLLVALGANPQTKVRSLGCHDSEIAQMPHLRIELISPVEATPATLAELEKTRSTRELVARVRGERATDSSDQFPAYWRAVSLSRGKFNLEPGDCELIEQLKRRVLPRLAVRIVKDNMLCTPHQLARGQPRLEVEALAEIPVQAPDQAAAERGPEGG